MASYDYRCRTCATGFTVTRSVTATATAVACPQGHAEAARVWSAIAVTGAAARSQGAAGGAATSGAGSASGCCGGGCCG